MFCGVFTFNGEESNVSVPLWILKQLQIETGDQVFVESVTTAIPKGMFVKFEPLTKLFLQIRDPKTVLEHCLRQYVCISTEDVISIYYNRNVYELRVCSTLPSDTIIINECDLTVDFQEMKQTEEDIQLPKECDLDHIQANAANQTNQGFKAFSGVGQSVSGKAIIAKKVENSSDGSDSSQEAMEKYRKGVPDNDYRVGTIYFKRYKKDLMTKEEEKGNESPNQRKRQVRTPIRTPVTRSQTMPFRTNTNLNSNDSQRDSSQRGSTAGTDVKSGSTPASTSDSKSKRRKPNDSSSDEEMD